MFDCMCNTQILCYVRIKWRTGLSWCGSTCLTRTVVLQEYNLRRNAVEVIRFERRLGWSVCLRPAVLNREGLKGRLAAATMSAVMKTSERPNQAEHTTYSHYPMRNEHQREEDKNENLFRISPSFSLRFQRISLHLFPFDFFIPFLRMSSLVSQPFCLFLVTTSKEIKAEKRSSCLSEALGATLHPAGGSVVRQLSNQWRIDHFQKKNFAKICWWSFVLLLLFLLLLFQFRIISLLFYQY